MFIGFLAWRIIIKKLFDLIVQIFLWLWIFFAIGLIYFRTIVWPNFDLFPQIKSPLGNYLEKQLSVQLLPFSVQTSWDGWAPQIEIEDLVSIDDSGAITSRIKKIRASVSWSWRNWSFYIKHLRVDQADINLTFKNTKMLDLTKLIQGSGNQFNPSMRLPDWVGLLENAYILVLDSRIQVTRRLNQGRLDHSEVLIHQAQIKSGLRSSNVYLNLSLSDTKAKSEKTQPITLYLDFPNSVLRDEFSWEKLRLFSYMDIPRFELQDLKSWVLFPSGWLSASGQLTAWFNKKRNTLKVASVFEVRSFYPNPTLSELPNLLSGKVQMLHYDDASQIFLNNIDIRLNEVSTKIPLSAYYEERNHQSVLMVNELNLALLAESSKILPSSLMNTSFLLATAPKGYLDDLTVTWHQNSSNDWSAKGSYDVLGWHAYKKIPGASNLKGNFLLSNEGGQVKLASKEASLNFPLVFDTPVFQFDELTGNVVWSLDNEQAVVYIQDLNLIAPEIKGKIEGTYKIKTNPSEDSLDIGYVNLQSSVSRVDANYVPRLIPKVISLGVRNWLNQAFKMGRLQDVRLDLEGNLIEFPFKKGGGRFEVVAHNMNDTSLFFADNWPLLDDMQGKLTFVADTMKVEVESAKTKDLHLTDFEVRIPGYSTGILDVEGLVYGDLSDLLSYFKGSPIQGYLNHVTDDFIGKGNFNLKTKLHFPLSNLRQTKVFGKLDIEQISLEPVKSVLFENMTGSVFFNEQSILSSHFKASLWSQPIQVFLRMPNRAPFFAQLESNLNFSLLARQTGLSFLNKLGGNPFVSADLVIESEKLRLKGRSNLRELESTLPYPFQKNLGEFQNLKFDLSIDGQNQKASVFLSYPKQEHSLLHGSWLASADKPLGRGKLAIGEVSLKNTLFPKTGMGVFIDFHEIDLSRWASLFSTKEALQSSKKPNTQLTWLSEWHLKTEKLRTPHVTLNEVSLDAWRKDGNWFYSILSDLMEGNVRYIPSDLGFHQGQLFANLDELHVSKKLFDLGKENQAPQYTENHNRAKLALPSKNKPLLLPKIQVDAKRVTLDGNELGRVNLNSQTDLDGNWFLSLNSMSSLHQLDVSIESKEAESSEVLYRLVSKDYGQFFSKLGMTETFREGNGKIAGDFFWLNSFWKPRLDELKGQFDIDIKDGRFRDAKIPFLGKFMRLFTLESIPKRLTFNFDDFKQGWAFNSFKASGNVEDQRINLNKLNILTNSERVKASGFLNIDQRTQNLDVQVYPKMSTFYLLGAAVWNPIVAGSLLFLESISDGQLDTVELKYQVEGAWSDPKVTDVRRK